MKQIDKSQRAEVEVTGSIVILIILAILIFLVCCFWLYPVYNVWASQKAGEAMLAHAQSAKEVAVAEAKAKMESATLLANAEIERAKGVAEANKIIGTSLKDNEAYLRYLWISGLENNNPTVIYVPTEANLPILEATRKPEPKK